MGRLFSPAELDMLRAVRASFDPEGILNPDKAVPLAGDEARRGVFAHA
jgi:FAD/FMN-containing dehydrogenase